MSNRSVKIFLFLIVTLGSYINSVHSAGSVIWNRDKNEFIPIETIPEFRAAGQNYFKKCRERETHVFINETIKVGFVETKDIINFYDNDTKVTGIIGDMWTTLSEHLNFKQYKLLRRCTVRRLVALKIPYTGMGLANGSYDGALGMLFRGEIQVIAVSHFNEELKDVVHTIQYWKANYNFYTKPTATSTSLQTFHMFSTAVWCLILVLFVFLGFVTYIIQRISNRVSRNRRGCYHLFDHLFYTFSVFCSQGFLPDSFYRHTKIISFTKAMFALIILTSAGSRIVSYTSNVKSQPPFEDLFSMFTTTNYSLIVNTKTTAYTHLKEAFHEFIDNEKYRNRIIDLPSHSERYRKMCAEEGDYVLFVNDIIHRTFDKTQCNLIETDKSYFSTWISAGLLKTYEYKKTIDMGMLKLMETGLWDRMKKRWQSLPINDEQPTVEPVSLRQVAIPFAILGIGMIASIIIFIIEHIVYNYNINQR